MATQPTTRSYAFSTVIKASFDDAQAWTRAALKEQGFGVLTEIDVQKTLQEKLGADFRPYVILGACNPPLAHRALAADLGVGLLLPCNVVVYDNGDGTSTIEALDPQAVGPLLGDTSAFAEVAAEASTRLRTALSTLTARENARARGADPAA